MVSLEQIADTLRAAAGALRFAPPVSHVYNPLEYAWQPHAQYLRRYGGGRRGVLLVGMNPGPWGMAQTGVPFGEVAAVRDWLRVQAPVARPAREHPRRPIHGFECRRSEVSGKRLWGWARARFATPEAFFARFFVHNYCPLALMEESGRNFTPDRLRRAEQQQVFAVCDEALRAVVDLLEPALVVGIGAFAEACARRAVGAGRRVGRLPHPSPASPSANRGWDAAADRALRQLGVPV